jgi:hypothetical protein
MKPKHYFDANLYARQLGFERVTRPPGSPGGDLLFFAMTPLRVVRRYRLLGASGEGPYRFAVRRTFAASRGSCLGRCLGRAHV